MNVTADKMHDGLMNNIESLVDLDYLEYSDTKEYREMSNAIYTFCEAYKQGIWTEDEE